MRSRVFLLAALAIAACNADTFTGDDGGGSDTGTDVPPVGGGDGGTDGASADGKVEAAPPPRFCETIDAAFCADFDIPGDAGAGFGSTQSGGWTYAFETDKSVSHPTGVRVDVPGDAGGVAILNTQLSPVANAAITLDLDVLLPPKPFSTTQPLFAFQFGTLSGPTLMFGLAHEGAWRLERASTSPGVTLSPQPPEGSWSHMQLVISLNGTAGTVNLFVDQTLSASLGGIPTAPATTGPFPAALQVGASLFGTVPTTGSTFFYDNAVIRTN